MASSKTTTLWERQVRAPAKATKVAAGKPAKAKSVMAGNAGRLAAATAKASKAAQQVAADEPAYEYPKGFKAPKNTALGADMYYTMKLKRLAMQKEVDALEAQEKALAHWLIESLPKGDSSGVAGKLARVAIVVKDVPIVVDRTKLYAAIVADYQLHAKKRDGQQDGAFALLTAAVGVKAVAERWKNGETVPGVGVFHKASLSVNKV